MTIYIAGKISGDPKYKRKFKRAEKALAVDGDVVLNPAWMPSNMDGKSAMKVCMAMIEVCDCVYLLPDWEKSNGAKLEKAYAEYLEKAVRFYAGK